MDIMTSAVYFPYVHPNEALLKRTLLTWDFVDVFADPEYRCEHLQGGDFREAWELVCRPRDFSGDSGEELRRRLMVSAESGIADDLRMDREKFERLGGLTFPTLKSRRVDDATAQLLLELDLATMDSNGKIRASYDVGYLMAAYQAEIAAGRMAAKCERKVNKEGESDSSGLVANC